MEFFQLISYFYASKIISSLEKKVHGRPNLLNLKVNLAEQNLFVDIITSLQCQFCKCKLRITGISCDSDV